MPIVLRKSQAKGSQLDNLWRVLRQRLRRHVCFVFKHYMDAIFVIVKHYKVQSLRQDTREAMKAGTKIEFFSNNKQHGF